MFGSPPPHDRRPTAHGDELPEAVARFVRRITWVLEDPAISARVAAAGISVLIELADVPDRVVALRFDRKAPSVVVDESLERPTVRLVLRSGDLDALLSEGSHLPMAIVAGDVAFEGAVRKLLRVMPILRGGAHGIVGEDAID